MRVLQFRVLCDTGGVSSSMLLLGHQMGLRGIDCEYWFCRSSKRFPEFEATGKATLAPLSKLAERLDRGDFDIVQMTASDPGADLVGHLAAGKARVVVTARGGLCDSWIARNCFAYTAISKGMAEVNQPYTDIAIEVVRNSINLDRFCVDNEPVGGVPIVAFVGRTKSIEKNFPRFARIASHLVSSGVRVWIADPHEGAWSDFSSHGLTPFETERWGPVAHDDMPAFYRAVAASGGVVVISSATEGFGNVAPEAAACGARVAASNVMGLREAVVDGVTGRLFSTSSSDADVAGMLRDWLASPHDRAAVSEAARREFSPSVMMDAYENIYARRESIRLAAPPRPHALGEEMPILLEHLEKQRAWRTDFEWKSAIAMANAGQRRQAIRAMSLAVGSSPGAFVSRTKAREFLGIARHMLRGREAALPPAGRG